MFVCEIWHKKSSHKGVFWCAWCICVRWQDQRNLSWKRPRIIKYNSEVNGQYGDGTPTLALPEPCSNLDYDDPCHYKSKFKCILRLGISQYLFFNRNLVEMERHLTFVQGVWRSQVQYVWSVYGACGEHRQVQAAGLHMSGKLSSNHWFSALGIGI